MRSSLWFTKLWQSTLIAILATACLYRFFTDCQVTIKETFDLGWLIQTGLYIQLHGIPHRDIFSWTNTDRSFIAYQWLSEVVIALIYQGGGLWLIGQIACLLAGLLYFFAMPAIWIKLRIKLSVTFALLALILTPHFFNARPQLASYFFFLMLVWILEQGKRSTRRFGLLIPVFLIWVNVHSFWLIGLLIAVVYLFANLKVIGLKSVLGLLIALGGSVLCNPYGIELVQYLWTFVDGSQFLGMREVLPSWSDPSASLWFAYLTISLSILIAGRQNISKPGLIVCIVIAGMALLVRRYQSVWVIVSWLYVGKALTSCEWATIKAPDFNKKILIPLLVTSIVVPFICWSMQCPNNKIAAQIFYEQNESILDWYKRLQPNYKGFADPTSGSWLIGRGYFPVFIDTRYDMYPKEFCQQVLETLRGDTGWQDFIKTKNVSMILVRNEFPLFAKLEEAQDWFPAVDNGRLSIWLHVSQKNPDRELAQLKLQNSQIENVLTTGSSEQLQTVKTRCRWYYKTSFNAYTAELSKQKITDALALMPESVILKKRWATLNTASRQK